MFILKKGHQPGVYVPLRALFLVCSFFFLSDNFFYNRYLSFYLSQGLQILYAPCGWPSILCIRRSRCLLLFLTSFSICSHLSLLCNAYGNFSVKDFSENT